MTRRRPGRLPRWQEWSVYLSFGILFATGIAWLLIDKFVQVAGEFGPEHHPAQHIALVVHGIAAYLFLIVFGAMVPVHVVAGWNTKRNLKTGVTLAATLLFVGATALALYYVGDEVLRPRASLAHWMVGVATLPLLLIHALRGRSKP
jgi:hypothetical protein